MEDRDCPGKACCRRVGSASDLAGSAAACVPLSSDQRQMVRRAGSSPRLARSREAPGVRTATDGIIVAGSSFVAAAAFAGRSSALSPAAVPYGPPPAAVPYRQPPILPPAASRLPYCPRLPYRPPPSDVLCPTVVMVNTKDRSIFRLPNVFLRSVE